LELHDIHSVRLAATDRREALRRSIGPPRPGEHRARRRIGRALVALGLRVAGEQLPEPVRRYA
jgi:hypothetical protein